MWGPNEQPNEPPNEAPNEQPNKAPNEQPNEVGGGVGTVWTIQLMSEYDSDPGAPGFRKTNEEHHDDGVQVHEPGLCQHPLAPRRW